MDSEAAPVGRTAANGSRTGPNTFTTRPSGRFRLSRTSAPREGANSAWTRRSEEHTSELQSHHDLVCRLLLEKKKKIKHIAHTQHNILEENFPVIRTPH